MLGVVAKRLFGTHNDRFLKRLRPEVAAINALEPELEALSDSALRARTDEFRERVQGLPMPQGGSFVAGETLQRSDDADRSGSRIWRFKPVERARPFEKGFSKVR